MNNSPTISVLTLVNGRKNHLINLITGLLKSNFWPLELIIVHLGENAWQVAEDVLQQEELATIDYQSSNIDNEYGVFSQGSKQLNVRQITLAARSNEYPLTKVRNRAVALAKGSQIICLDVNCIPAKDYLEDMSTAISKTNGLVMSDVHYLANGANEKGWTFQQLEASAIPHPRRPTLMPGELQRSDKYYLFWTLSFGCTKETFARIGGFDTRFIGYGGEDTDFALSARNAGVPLYLSGTIVYHQYYSKIYPPLNHLEDIIKNANIYKKKWGKWPMESWLRAFQKGGFVDWNEQKLKLRRLPTSAEIKSHKSEKLFT